MKLYLLEQKLNNGYDTYDSCIVVANDENEARTIHPGTNPRIEWGYNHNKSIKENNDLNWYNENIPCFLFSRTGHDWIKTIYQKDIKVTYIGEADLSYKEAQCILASFNAG